MSSVLTPILRPRPFKPPSPFLKMTRSLHHQSPYFRIEELTVPTQHSRERPATLDRASGSRDDEVRMHVKRYIPNSNKPSGKLETGFGDVTIIGAQANGFPKECYEPFWEDLCEQLRERGKGVRGIWVADMVGQGRSGVLKEALLGPDQSWWDHGRDLLFLINQFQRELPHPIVGVGHSVGASHLWTRAKDVTRAHLSLLHPRLLHSLVFIDPIMQPDVKIHTALARLSTNRRDIWPSRKAAAEAFRGSKFYQKWDPRVLEKWIEFGLRDLPTEQYPLPPGAHKDEPPVTLTTTVAQEVYFYLRAYYRDRRLLQDDEELPENLDPPFDMPEGRQLYERLPEIKPSVQFVFGSKSEASPPESRQDKMQKTGVGFGGSGGAQKGRVKEAVLDCGHLVGMEKPKECAEVTAGFLKEELERWEAREKRRDEAVAGLSRKERVGINALWREKLGVEEPGKGKKKETKL
ncbi:uncharacterized protein LTR77_006965 [Saxophila tyrrhenica]|uniref:AB hydrolase-1 domain-containing protein n=1 Tax=Saxophila tyrrhenica TaxID=1690608 RepID=A0AAV9P654_9PEZI|nr:hypothetical protein LTR77_006965 [Saxophila tyrrhenica]